jgi:hypothetical protein
LELGPKPFGDPDAPRLDDDFHKHPLQPPAFATSPEDGLPMPAVNVSFDITGAPPLLPETFVCMGDYSRFVVRKGSREVISFVPAQVERDDNGGWVVQAPSSDDYAIEQKAWWEDVCRLLAREGVIQAPERPSFWVLASLWVCVLTSAVGAALGLTDREGPLMVIVAAFSLGVSALVLRAVQARAVGWPSRIHVEPLRRQCANYRRQLTDHQGDAEHRSLNRYCTAFRDENGEFVALRDSRIYSCELRSPSDPITEKLLDAFDEEAVAKARQQDEEFDVAGALDDEKVGGIFER